MNSAENNDESVKHENGLGSHHCYRGHGEVVDEQWADGTAHFVLSAVDTNQEEEEHEEECNAELGVKFACFFLPNFPAALALCFTL